MDAKIAHLQLLQAVITRMGGNSFLLKGWTVTLVAALFALAAVKTMPYFIYLTYFPLLVFWMLDGYFLRQERLFRKLYDRVRILPNDAIDFSMDTSTVAPDVKNWRDTCISTTLVMFYGAIFAAVVIVMLILIARA